MSGTRKDPLRIRRKSTKEFGRVLGLLRKWLEKLQKAFEDNSEEINALKVRVATLEGKKRKRGRPRKNPVEEE